MFNNKQSTTLEEAFKSLSVRHFIYLDPYDPDCMKMCPDDYLSVNNNAEKVETLAIGSDVLFFELGASEPKFAARILENK